MYQLTDSLEIIKKWDTIKSAALFLNICSDNIIRVCKHKEGRTSYAGYRWLYEDEYENKNFI